MPKDNGMCFVLSEIGSKRADSVLKNVISEAVKPFGYEVIRGDQISQTGDIAIQVFGHIEKASLVVADLTEHRPNVFYEIAISHMLRKPTIHIIEDGWEIPFYLKHNRIIYVKHQDVNSVTNCKNEMIRQIESIRTYSQEEDQDSPLSRVFSKKDLIKNKEILDGIHRGLTELRKIIDGNGQALAAIESKLTEFVNSSSAYSDSRLDPPWLRSTGS